MRIVRSVTTGFALCAIPCLLFASCVASRQAPRPAAEGDGATLRPLGRHEKIRFFFSQWHHFKGVLTHEQLMSSLAKVGASAFADWGCNEDRARAAHAHGIHYF